jgi:hypothetical protein
MTPVSLKNTFSFYSKRKEARIQASFCKCKKLPGFCSLSDTGERDRAVYRVREWIGPTRKTFP